MDNSRQKEMERSFKELKLENNELLDKYNARDLNYKQKEIDFKKLLDQEVRKHEEIIRELEMLKKQKKVVLY